MGTWFSKCALVDKIVSELFPRWFHHKLFCDSSPFIVLEETVLRPIVMESFKSQRKSVGEKRQFEKRWKSNANLAGKRVFFCIWRSVRKRRASRIDVYANDSNGGRVCAFTLRTVADCNNNIRRIYSVLYENRYDLTAVFYTRQFRNVVNDRRLKIVGASRYYPGAWVSLSTRSWR